MEDFGFRLQNIGKNELQLRKIIKVALLFIAIILLIIASVKIIKSFYKDEITNINNIPLIKAQSKDIKILPTNTGGLVVDNLDINVYNVLDNKDNKNVNPVVKKTQQNIETPELSSNDDIITEQEMLANKINEIHEEEIVDNSSKDEKQDIKANEVVEDNDKKVPNIKINSEDNNIKTNIMDLEKLGNKSLITNLKEHKDKKPSVKIQLLALKSRNSVIEYWEELNKKYKQLFNDKNYYIESVDLSNVGTIYRLQVGDFESYDLANNFCKEYIKVANKNRIDCIVIKE